MNYNHEQEQNENGLVFEIENSLRLLIQGKRSTESKREAVYVDQFIGPDVAGQIGRRG